jgi:hypothetical protein
VSWKAQARTGWAELKRRLGRGRAGTYFDIEPSHFASVVGDEPCLVIDWGEDWSQFED